MAVSIALHAAVLGVVLTRVSPHMPRAPAPLVVTVDALSIAPRAIPAASPAAAPVTDSGPAPDAAAAPVGPDAGPTTQPVETPATVAADIPADAPAPREVPATAAEVALAPIDGAGPPAAPSAPAAPGVPTAEDTGVVDAQPPLDPGISPPAVAAIQPAGPDPAPGALPSRDPGPEAPAPPALPQAPPVLAEAPPPAPVGDEPAAPPLATAVPGALPAASDVAAAPAGAPAAAAAIQPIDIGPVALAPSGPPAMPSAQPAATAGVPDAPPAVPPTLLAAAETPPPAIPPATLLPTVPSATLGDPPARPTAPLQTARLEAGRSVAIYDFVDRYDGGPCFFAAVIDANGPKPAIGAFGTEAGAFHSLDARFASTLGIEADIRAQRVSAPQCPAVDLLRRTGRETLQIAVSTDRLMSGDTLSGEITGFGRDAVALFSLDETGRVTDLTSHLVQTGVQRRFAVPVTQAPGHGAPARLLVALAGADVSQTAFERALAAHGDVAVRSAGKLIVVGAAGR